MRFLTTCFLLLGILLAIAFDGNAQPFNINNSRTHFTEDVLFDKTLRLPRHTTTKRNQLSPLEGMMIYNTTLDSVQVYRNTSWVTLGGVGSGGDGLWEISSGTFQPSTFFTRMDITRGGLSYVLNDTTNMHVGSWSGSRTAAAGVSDHSGEPSANLFFYAPGTTTAVKAKQAMLDMKADTVNIRANKAFRVHHTDTDTVNAIFIDRNGVAISSENDPGDGKIENSSVLVSSKISFRYEKTLGQPLVYSFPSDTSSVGDFLKIAVNDGNGNLELNWAEPFKQQAALTATNDTTGLAAVNIMYPATYETIRNLYVRLNELEARLGLVGILPE